MISTIWRRLGSGSFFLFSGLMLANAVAYAYQMVMARMMSPADYGIFVTLTSVSYLLAVIMRTVQAWMIKAVATTTERSGELAAGVVAIAVRLVLPIASLALVISWLASAWVSDFLRIGDEAPVIILGLYAFSSFLVPIPRGVLIGLSRLRFAGVVQVMESVARLLAGTALVLWGTGVNGALAGFIVGNVVAFIIAFAPLRAFLKHRSTRRPDIAKGVRFERYAVSALLVNAFLMIIASIDQVAVKHFFSEQVAGNYAVAFLAGRVIAMSAMALGWVIFARSANTQVQGVERARMLVKFLALTSSLALSVAAAYLMVPRVAILLMGGAKYALADSYIGLVGIEMSMFALVYVQAYYLISVQKMQVQWPLGFAVLLEVVLMMQYHDSVQQLLSTLILVMAALLVFVSALSWSAVRQRVHPLTATAECLPESAAHLS